GERSWFVGYSVTSFIYRVFIVVAILLFLTDQFFVLGMFFAILTAFTWFVLPLGKGLKYLFTSPRIRRVRGRALAVTSGAALWQGEYHFDQSGQGADSGHVCVKPFVRCESGQGRFHSAQLIALPWNSSTLPA
ncbi:MAG: hypothetical protein ACKVQA_05210, partial [Burkholderiales bacterium]